MDKKGCCFEENQSVSSNSNLLMVVRTVMSIHFNGAVSLNDHLTVKRAK